MPEPHKILRGQGAGDLLAFARAKLDRLVAECEHARARARARAPVRTKRFVVRHGGGTFDIAVQVFGEQHYIKIERKTCPPFLSGFCDMVFHIKEDDVLAGFTPVYEVLDADNPSETINVFRRFYPCPGIPDEDRAWRDERRLAVNGDAARQMLVLRASMFSGEMSKVVQVLQGRNETIPYSPTYAVTHGVFKSSSGQRWIIEISNQGVVAWVIGMCRNPISNAAGEQVLDYTPIVTPKPQDIEAATQAGTYIALAPASAVLDAYTKNVFYTNCGWAFNADGHAASNVAWQDVGGRKKSYLYTITITESESRPVSASLALIDEGWIHGPKTSHPKYQIGNDVRLYSFDPFYDNFDFIYECHAPVFCFYDGAELKTAYYRYSPVTNENTYTDSTLPNFGGFNPMADNGVEKRSGTRTTATDPYFQFDGWANDGAIRTDSITRSRWDAVDVGYLVYFTVAPQTATDLVYRVSYSSTTDLQVTRVIESLIVPLYNREAMYLVREHNAQITPTSGQSRTLRGRTHVFSNTTIENCLVFGPHLLQVGGEGIELLVGQIEFGPNPVDVSPAAQPGSTYVFSTEDCVAVPLNRIANPDVVSTGAQPTYHVPEKRFEYFAAGGVRHSLPMPAGTTGFSGVISGLFDFLEYSNQVLVSIADAFDPARFIISPDADKNSGAECVTTAVDYPVAEAGRAFSFVGVP